MTAKILGRFELVEKDWDSIVNPNTEFVQIYSTYDPLNDDAMHQLIEAQIRYEVFKRSSRDASDMPEESIRLSDESGYQLRFADVNSAPIDPVLADIEGSVLNPEWLEAGIGAMLFWWPKNTNLVPDLWFAKTGRRFALYFNPKDSVFFTIFFLRQKIQVEATGV